MGSREPGLSLILSRSSGSWPLEEVDRRALFSYDSGSNIKERLYLFFYIPDYWTMYQLCPFP